MGFRDRGVRAATSVYHPPLHLSLLLVHHLLLLQLLDQLLLRPHQRWSSHHLSFPNGRSRFRRPGAGNRNWKRGTRSLVQIIRSLTTVVLVLITRVVGGQVRSLVLSIAVGTHGGSTTDEGVKGLGSGTRSSGGYIVLVRCWPLDQSGQVNWVQCYRRGGFC